MSKPQVVIGTYLYSGKKYCVKEWLANTITIMNDYHSSSELIIVDNSNDKVFSSWLRLLCDGYVEKDRIKVLHLPKMKYKHSRHRQKASQEVLWKYTLDNDYEYLFILESDVFPEKKNIISKLKAENKLVCSGVFPLANGETANLDMLCVMGYQMKPGTGMFWFRRDQFAKAIDKFGDWSKAIKIYACGFGCILIKRNVLELIKPEYGTKGELAALTRIRKAIVKESNSYGVRNFLLKETKRLLKIEKNSVAKKIHPDTNYMLMCEMYGVPRHVVPDQNCVHKNQGWDNLSVKR